MATAETEYQFKNPVSSGDPEITVENDISYLDLFNSDNTNPASYNVSDLPIVLSDPGQRPGYAFKGWIDAMGQRVAEISAGTTGELSLTAVWEKLFLKFDGNAKLVYNVPSPIPAQSCGTVRIPAAVPGRPCYRFVCWNIPDSGAGRVYFPGDAISVSGSSVTLHAQWQLDSRSCHSKYTPHE